MSTYNICFCAEIRKNTMWIPTLIWGYALTGIKNCLVQILAQAEYGVNPL